MAHIKKMTDKPRKRPWHAQVRRKGHGVLVKFWPTKAEAEHWAAEQERAIRLTGLPQTLKTLEKDTVETIVRKYLKDVTPTKECRISETAVIKKFLRHKIRLKSLAYVTGKPKGVMLEEVVEKNMIKFNSEEEMNKWVEQRKKHYQSRGLVVPFPPEI